MAGHLLGLLHALAAKPQQNGGGHHGITAASVFAVLGAIASAIGIVGFVPWVLQQRRRPEVRFLWRYAEGDREEAVTDWPHETVPAFAPGSTIIVETSVQNVGDATAEAVQSNFVVPESVTLSAIGADRRVLFSHSRTAGEAPGHGVYFIVHAFKVAPGDWTLQRFRLVLPDQPVAQLRVLFTLSEGRLNVSGWRLLPSRLTDGDAPESPAGSAWPPPGEPVHWWNPDGWRRAVAQPKGRVLCRRGVRADVRDLQIRA